VDEPEQTRTEWTKRDSVRLDWIKLGWLYAGFVFTSGLVCGEDSLSRSDDPVRDVAELFLLLGTEERVGVRHLESVEEEEGEMVSIATRYQLKSK